MSRDTFELTLLLVATCLTMLTLIVLVILR